MNAHRVLLSVALLVILLVSYQSGTGAPPPPAATPQESSTTDPVFLEVAAQVGLDFQHFLGATGEYYFPEIVGAGVALFDYDGDNDLDVFLVQGTLLDRNKALSQVLFAAPPNHRPGNRLFRNELVPAGVLRFRDVTEEAGLSYEGYGMGAAVGDIDNDGDPDLYVTNFGANVLYRNEGNGRFSDITKPSGTDDPRWSTSAAFVDYDLDSDLDLFVTQYVAFSVQSNQRCTGHSSEREYCNPQNYDPLTDRLFRNEGEGKFTDVSLSAGIQAAFGSGLGVIAADFNRDGWPDIYVANDKRANQQGTGKPWTDESGEPTETTPTACP